MAKGGFGGRKAPAFVSRGKGKPPAFGKVAREAKAEGEPVDVERREMAAGFKRGGKAKGK